MNITVRKLMRVEQVGYHKAKRIVNELGPDATNCSSHRLREVHGVGDVLADRIIAEFSRRKLEQFTPVE